MTASHNTDHTIRYLFLYSNKTIRRKTNPDWRGISVYFLITWVTVVKNTCSVYLKCQFTFVGSQRVTQTFLLHTTQYFLAFTETSQETKLIQLPLKTERKMHKNKCINKVNPLNNPATPAGLVTSSERCFTCLRIY